jgi:hypothetical protein
MTQVILAILFIFLLGVLVGNGMNTRAQKVRYRRQAATQRRINAELRLLREHQEAAEEEMRWASKQRRVARGNFTPGLPRNGA